MKKLVFLVVIFSLIMTGYIFNAPIKGYAENILYQSPCDTSRTYRIGSIDPKYNLTKEQFLTNINSSEEIWENQIGKNLFSYSPTGDIEINLVYDQRQFLSSQINDLGSKIKTQQNELDPQITDYKKRLADFRAKAEQLNNEIASWNNKGGAPEDEYNKLTSRQTALQQEADSLQEEAGKLNQSTDEYNQQVGQLRQTVNSFNQELSYKPEEGEYILQDGKETINIYFDNSPSELIHTLAHELGHALSIGHNTTPSSIMHAQTNESVTLSSEDILGLEKACEKKSVIEEGAKRFAVTVNSLISSF